MGFFFFFFLAFPLDYVRGFILSGSCDDSDESGATRGDKQTMCLHNCSTRVAL